MAALKKLGQAGWDIAGTTDRHSFFDSNGVHPDVLVGAVPEYYGRWYDNVLEEA